MENINRFASLEKMNKIIDQYSELLVTLSNDRDRSLNQLAGMCSSERYIELTKKLLESHRLQTGEEMKHKQKKINRMVDKEFSGTKSETNWLPALGLSTSEKACVENNDYICDSIINASMLILNRSLQFMTFQSTTLQHHLLQYSPFETIHIHHNGHGHFATTTSVGGRI